METSGKISFAPKSSFSGGKEYYRKVGSGFILKISGLLLIISLLSFAGVTLYERMISRETEDLSASLDRAKAAFEPSLITQLENLSFSLPDAGVLLEQHLYPTRILKLLEETTIKEVAFSGFSYSYGKGEAIAGKKTKVVENVEEQNKITIQLSGQAKSYEALAQQSDIYDKNIDIKDFSFSGFGITGKGNVSFSLNMVVSPAINR